MGVATLVTDRFANDDTVGSAPPTLPDTSVCFTCVPLAMYCTGCTAEVTLLGPTARNRYLAV